MKALLTALIVSGCFITASAQNNSLGIVRGTPVDAIHKELMPEG